MKSTKVLVQGISIDVLYDDEHLLVINKPSGLVVHPAEGTRGITLLDALSSPGEVPGMVHRLDKETSLRLAQT